jgi:hypothetical protein
MINCLVVLRKIGVLSHIGTNEIFLYNIIFNGNHLYRQYMYLYYPGVTSQNTEEAIASTVIHEQGKKICFNNMFQLISSHYIIIYLL